jgi:hypothetical protein
MRSARIVVGILVGATAVLALAGCVQPAPRVIPTSEPSSAPVFASDAAALAAARKAYTGYVAASDAIGNDGGTNPQRIAKWVTPERLKTETKAFNTFAKSGGHLEGSSVVSHFSIERVDQSRTGKVAVTAYACDDVSNSRLIDASGTDITSPSREDVVPLEVSFQNLHSGSSTLVVEGSDPWSGTDFCS